MQALNKNLDLKSKMVFVRVDFNVPLNEHKEITSKKRIDATLPQIDYLREKGAKIVLCSHLGRPNGTFNKDLSLKPVYEYLQTIYDSDILFSNEIVGSNIEEMKSNLQNSQILLLENVRFEKGEEECEKSFALELAMQIDIFIDEAFAVSHRKSASNFLMSEIIENSFYGFNHLKERQNLTLKYKEKPILAILGGAKVADKIKLIFSLLDKVDDIFIGGAMAFTFLKSQGITVGQSLVEDDLIDLAKEILIKAKNQNVKIHLPLDVVVAKSIDDVKNAKNVDINEIPHDLMGLDIGQQSIKQIQELISNSKTIFWNGPLGVASVKEFSYGTIELVKMLSQSKAFTIVGGGDSVEVVERLNLQNQISFVSTGGGASLKYIQKD